MGNQACKTGGAHGLELMGDFVSETGQRFVRLKGFREAISPKWPVALAPKRPGTIFNFSIDQIEAKTKEVFSTEQYLRVHGLSLVDKDVLEIGCHVGIHSFVLAEMGCRTVHGIDIPEYGVRQSSDLDINSEDIQFQSGLLDRTRQTVSNYFSPQAQAKVSFEDIDIVNLDCEDRFDVIVSWKSLEHIENPCIAFEKMFAALRPGGICFHEYNPFFCCSGGHDLCTLDFLYGHCRLSESDFKRYIKTLRPEEEKIAIRFFEHNLNRMSLADLSEYIEAAGFETISIIPWMKMQDLDRFDAKVLRQVRANYPNVTEKDLLAETVWVLISKPAEQSIY